jgi:lysophospholipase
LQGSDAIHEWASSLLGGDVALHMWSVVPRSSWATLAFVHGYGDHGGRHAHFLRWLAERGVACHAIDLRGHGRSGGRRGFVKRWEEYLHDVAAFLQRVTKESTTPTFLLGHSHGGLVAAAAVERGIADGVRGCVLTAPYFASKMVVPRGKVLLARVLDPVAPWMRVGSGLPPEWMTADEGMIAESRADALMLRSATPRWYLTTLRVQDEVLASASTFRAPLLLLFGDADPVADLATARRFFEAAGATDKTMKVYPGLLHELSREVAREQVFEDVLAWLKSRSNLG